ncbi:MAG TPA: oligopeptide/dipeptide ABC transporter ATP-binding protein [Baekduia sp.]|nr:oligopeptide/dipeptide ABC transporter ATP-binding protein [Baekduia sp.]
MNVSGQAGSPIDARVPVPTPLLTVKGLRVDFSLGRRHAPVRAVDDVSFAIAERETLGVVGESGSGKSTIGRAILGLTAIEDGEVIFAGSDIAHASSRQRRAMSTDLQVVFQDPYGSLNPSRKVGESISEPLRAHRGYAKADAKRLTGEMLDRVGLPADAADRFPSQFSGGQRQRIAIARALIVQPRLVVCDEPVSALDLCVQAQVINLLRDVQDSTQLSYLFISHDLDVVRYMADRVLVLYRGRVMEVGDAEAVAARPAHPYTQALLQAQPVPDPAVQRRRKPFGLAPDQAPAQTPANACPFSGRCPHVQEICVTQRPGLEAGPDGRQVACHRWRELELAGETSGASANNRRRDRI